MVHVEVEVEAKVVPQAVLEGLDVGFASVEPLFFAAPSAEPKGALGRAGLVHHRAQLASNFHHAGGARGVVHGALAVIDGVVVAADDDDLGGFPADFSAGHVDGALLVVGDIDDHLQHALGTRCVEDGLFEDLASIF